MEKRTSSVSFTLSAVIDGKDGQPGNDGVSIVSANVWYAVSDHDPDAIEPDDGEFIYDNFPNDHLTPGMYVWQATKIELSNHSSKLTAYMCLGVASDFLQGEEVYATSQSADVVPQTWSPTYTQRKGYYLWTATKVTYTNGQTVQYLHPKCVGYWGTDGEDGENGPKGDNGDDGYGLTLTPAQLIFEEKLGSDGQTVSIDYTNNTVTAMVQKGKTPLTPTITKVETSDSYSGCDLTKITISGGTITMTSSSITLASGASAGFFTVNIKADNGGYDRDVRINFYVNRMGTFKREVKGDMEKVAASKIAYALQDGGAIKSAYDAAIETSAKGLTQQFTEQISRAGDYGRNLFGFHKGADFSGFATIPFIQGYGLVVTANNSDINRRQGRVSNLGFENVGGYFVVTFMAKTNADFTSYPSQQYAKVRVDLCDVEPIHDIGSIDGNINIVVNNNWQSYEIHFFLPEENPYMGSDSYNGFLDFEEAVESGIAPIITNQGAYIYIRHLKVERGQTATKFCEADEDIAAIGQGDIIPEWDYQNMSYAPSVIINGVTYPNYYNQTIDLNAGKDIWCLSKSGLPFSVKAGKIYTLSYWARTSNAGMVIRNHLYNQDDPQVRIIDINIYGIYDAGAVGTIIESAVSDGRTGVRLSTTWKQYFVHFYVTRDVSNMNCCACVVFRDDNEIRNSSGVVTGYRSGTIYFADVRLQEGYVMDASSFASLIEQNARRISLVQQSGTKRAGIDIQNGTVNLFGDRVTFSNADGTVKNKVWIDPATGAIHAVDGDFAGEITAKSGKIGGFAIDDTRLNNENWEAGIDISYEDGGKVVKIGKNAKGESFTEDAIIRAENTKALGGSHTTALYLNASGATNNYAFYGKGNGVLDGYVQGFKAFAITNLGKVSNPYQINLRNGMVQAIVSVGINEDKFLRLPSLGEIKQTLGINANATTNFTCQLVLINQSAIQSTSHNRDNVWVKGSSEAYNKEITDLEAIPRILRKTDDQKVMLDNATMLIFHITYINRRFIANYIYG